MRNVKTLEAIHTSNILKEKIYNIRTHGTYMSF